MFGIGHFSAIINPPQCGILAVGSGRPVIGEKTLILIITHSYFS
jgi:pyruvate/2-oxoglutarate dehydrogenase complex dihydrolipoamide acyltransferase (E2) component